MKHKSTCDWQVGSVKRQEENVHEEVENLSNLSISGREVLTTKYKYFRLIKSFLNTHIIVTLRKEDYFNRLCLFLVKF